MSEFGTVTQLGEEHVSRGGQLPLIARGGPRLSQIFVTLTAPKRHEIWYVSTSMRVARLYPTFQKAGLQRF